MSGTRRAVPPPKGVTVNMTRVRAGMVHLWRGVRAGIVVLAASPAVQAFSHGGTKPDWFAITSACVAAAVTAESVYSASPAAASPPPPAPVAPLPPGQ